MGDDENGEEKEEEGGKEKDVAMMFDGEVRRKRGWGGTRRQDGGWIELVLENLEDPPPTTAQWFPETHTESRHLQWDQTWWSSAESGGRGRCRDMRRLARRVARWTISGVPSQDLGGRQASQRFQVS